MRIYKPPELNPLFNQSNMVVTVETDIGITGIGEGGAKDTLEQCAGTLIGKNPFRIEAHLAGDVHRLVLSARAARRPTRSARSTWRSGTSRARRSALPVHELLGGAVRDYCECYATGGVDSGRRPGRRDAD